jgi:hypothetical protein
MKIFSKVQEEVRVRSPLPNSAFVMVIDPCHVVVKEYCRSIKGRELSYRLRVFATSRHVGRL